MNKDTMRTPFTYKVVSVENQPRIYAIPTSEQQKTLEKKPQTQKDDREKGLFSFFGHRLEKLFAPAKRGEEEELPPIEKELEWSLEEVQKKLAAAQAARRAELDVMAKERMKHEDLMEKRNRSQALLFKDIVEYHGKFGTGLKEEDLWSLHSFMKNAADHEMDCSSHELLHKHIECDVISFLRRKALEKAWESLEKSVDRFSVPFPVPTSMVDHEDEVRNEKVKEERKKAAGDDFRKMPPQQIAEMILGNIPVWVYSYPEKDSYLWLLTVLQGVAAGITVKLFLNYLGFWERNSSLLLKKIEGKFTRKIREIRERGKEAADLTEVFSVSRELQRISKEEIPNYIWSEMSSELTSPSG